MLSLLCISVVTTLWQSQLTIRSALRHHHDKATIFTYLMSIYIPGIAGGLILTQILKAFAK